MTESAPRSPATHPPPPPSAGELLFRSVVSANQSVLSAFVFFFLSSSKAFAANRFKPFLGIFFWKLYKLQFNETITKLRSKEKRRAGEELVKRAWMMSTWFVHQLNIDFWDPLTSTWPVLLQQMFWDKKVILSFFVGVCLFVCFIDKTRTVKPQGHFHSWILSFTQDGPAGWSNGQKLNFWYQKQWNTPCQKLAQISRVVLKWIKWHSELVHSYQKCRPWQNLECSPGIFRAESKTVLGKAQSPQMEASQGLYCSGFIQPNKQTNKQTPPRHLNIKPSRCRKPTNDASFILVCFVT